MIEEIRKKAGELLRAKQAELILGYKRAPNGIFAIPAFINDEKDVDALIWDAYCVYNLANYLKEFSGKKIGIVAKSCDAKSIIVLLAENQLKREDIFIIGVECRGVISERGLDADKETIKEIGFDERCQLCKPSTPTLYDALVREKKQKHSPEADKDGYDSVRKFEAKSTQEKSKFWQEEFSRCIRCYACRQICPSCYCPTCVADQTMPAWFSKATAPEGNFAWNVNRAMHLAGRCVDCGECERVCPVGIPLRDINKKIEKDIKELFGFEAGLNAEQKPLFSCFDKNDPQDFIK